MPGFPFVSLIVKIKGAATSAQFVELARILDQSWGLVSALYFRSLLHQMRGDKVAAAKDVEELALVNLKKVWMV